MEAPTDLLAVLVRSWRIVAAVCLIGLVGGLLLAVKAPPRYDATALVVVVPSDPQQGGGTEAVSYAQAYARVTTSDSLLLPALRDAGLDPTNPGVSVRASSSSNTPVVEIVASGAEAPVATEVANEVADRLMSYSSGVGQSTGYGVRLFSRATVPTASSSRGPALGGMLGATLGLILGGILAVVRDAFRTHRPEPVRRSDELTEEEELETFLRAMRSETAEPVGAEGPKRNGTARNGTAHRENGSNGSNGTQRSRAGGKRDAKGRYVRAEESGERTKAPATERGDGDGEERPVPMNRRDRRALARQTAKGQSQPRQGSGPSSRPAGREPDTDDKVSA